MGLERGLGLFTWKRLMVTPLGRINSAAYCVSTTSQVSAKQAVCANGFIGAVRSVRPPLHEASILRTYAPTDLRCMSTYLGQQTLTLG
jgi:hypothetical protein